MTKGLKHSMKVTVDYNLCASTGSCVQTCPEVFALSASGKLQILQESPAEAFRDAVLDAADLCPMGAISVEE